jgi:CheY-like chemotaxis protein
MLVDLLRPLGFEPIEAADGQQAIDMVQAHRPDLVLMDLAMPVMDGLEATRRIRAASACGDVPILALSANASSDHRQQALDAGASAFLAKPVVRDDLLAQLGVSLSLTWRRDASN